MKAFATTILGFACLGLLIFGNLHWQDKIKIANDESEENVQTAKIEPKEDSTEELGEYDQRMINNYSANWSDKEKQNLQNAIAEKRPYKILIAGSSALGEGEDSWPSLFKEAMINTYGDNVISIVIRSYEENSEEFILANKQQEFIKEDADLILWEPFTLNDNGEVVIERSHENIMYIMNEVIEANSNTTIILQPPNPLHQAKFYPVQVSALKDFAEEHGFTYLDHWSSWPDPTSDQMLEYLNADEETPSKEGHRVWSDFLINYFIKK